MHYINALLRIKVNNCITLGIIYETNRIDMSESSVFNLLQQVGS